MECVILETLSSLAKIFSEKIYRIPDYQRGYAWTLKEVEDFWDDLCRLETNKNHYVGVLTLEPTKKIYYDKWIEDTWIIEHKSYDPFYIVDGQQRITTAIILIVAILKVMKERNIDSLNFTSYDEIRRKYIYESKDKTINRTYIFGYENDNPSYAYLIKEIYEQKIIQENENDNTIYTKNLLEAKKFFYEKLISLSIDDLEKVHKKITQRFLFNIYTITDDIDVYVTFETMNNRGKLLSKLELLKNRLIYISTLFNEEDNQKQLLRKDINNCWKKIYHILGKSIDVELSDDEFLITHSIIYFSKLYYGSKKRNSIIYYYHDELENKRDFLLNDYFIPQKIIENKLKIKDCSNYIYSLNDYIDFWLEIKNPQYSKYNDEIKAYIYKINSCKKHFYFLRRRIFNPRIRYNRVFELNLFLLISFFKCKNNERLLLKFLKTLERYLFVISFFERVIERKFIIDFREESINLAVDKITIENLIKKLEDMSNTLVNNEEMQTEIIRSYGKIGFYNTNDWIRYFLCEYEYSLMKKSKTNIDRFKHYNLTEKRYESIEHIYPRNSNNKKWIEVFKDLTAEEKEKVQNSLGNLVIVTPEKNSRLGNLPFEEKICNKDNTIGYKYGTYAEIEVTNYKEWDLEAIEKRGLKLITFLLERWGIKIGNGKKDDKRRFLGLGFIKNKEVQG